MDRPPPWACALDWPLVTKIAVKNSLDPDLVAAVIQTESGGNTYACRYEPHYKYSFKVVEFAKLVGATPHTMMVMQKTSWGLLQCMGSTAYEMGLSKMPSVHERWPSAMINPEIGLEMGCRYLRKQFTKYGPMVDKVYAAYNAGSPRYRQDQFVNQKAVDRFMTFYHEVKNI